MKGSQEITFEAARWEFDLLEVLAEQNFQREVGSGVYDLVVH